MHEFRVSTATGLEQATVSELDRLGIAAAGDGRGVVQFCGSAEDGVRAALTIRSAPRIVWEVARGLPTLPQTLFEALAELPWPDWFSSRTTIAVRAVGTNDALRHTGFTARFVKDGIKEAFTRRSLTAPEVAPAAPQLLIDVRLRRDQISIGFDLSGGSLHRRAGSRSIQAPLREDLAAGLAILAGLDPERPLLDPFCGSGTLIAEAASVALGRLPDRQPQRMSLSFLKPFQNLPLVQIRDSLAALERQPVAPILAYDVDPIALEQAEQTLRRAGLSDAVELRRGRVPGIRAIPASPGVVISNPPWGRRLRDQDVHALWRDLGAWAKQSVQGWTLGLLCGDPELSAELRMKASRRFAVNVSGVDTRFLIYEVRPASAPTESPPTAVPNDTAS